MMPRNLFIGLIALWLLGVIPYTRRLIVALIVAAGMTAEFGYHREDWDILDYVKHGEKG